jgi:hypothetical protein
MHSGTFAGRDEESSGGRARQAWREGPREETIEAKAERDRPQGRPRSLEEKVS